MSPAQEHAADYGDNQAAGRDVDHELVKIDGAFAEEWEAVFSR